VLADIQRVFALARDYENNFVELVSKQSQQVIDKTLRKAKAEYSKGKSRIEQLDNIITQIYEDKVNGQLSPERFAKMLDGYEREQTQLKLQMSQLKALIDEESSHIVNVDKFLKLVKSHTEIETLTEELVSEFVEKIIVGETVLVNKRKFAKWADEKRQEVRIIYNYIGTIPHDGSETLTIKANNKSAYKS
jgi:ABC-type transporter MlaC component